MGSSPTSSVTRAASTERHYDAEEKGSANGSSATNEKKRATEDQDGQLELPTSADLRTKDTILIKKRWWLKAPREPYPSLEEVPTAPLATANFLSKITFYCEQPQPAHSMLARTDLFLVLLHQGSSRC